MEQYRVRMIFNRHRESGSGFQVKAEPEDRLSILEAGEIWAPRSWSIQTHVNE